MIFPASFGVCGQKCSHSHRSAKRVNVKYHTLFIANCFICSVPKKEKKRIRIKKWLMHKQNHVLSAKVKKELKRWNLFCLNVQSCCCSAFLFLCKNWYKRQLHELVQENPKYPTHFLTVIFVSLFIFRYLNLAFVPFLIIITQQVNTHKGTECQYYQ